MNYSNRINLFLIVILSPFTCWGGIREYQPRDLAAFCQIMKSEWSKLSTIPIYNQPMIDSMFAKLAPFDPTHKDKKLHIIVCEIDGEVVGFATYYYSDPITGHIELLAIAPGHQSKGYGKQMIEYIQQEFLRNNAQYIQLYVYPSNPKAIEFYKRLGFSIKIRAMQHWLLNKILK